MNTPTIPAREWKEIHDQMDGDSLKVLNEMHIRSEKLKFPLIKQNYGDKYFEYKRSEYKENSANALTKSIIAYIRLRGFQAERISSGGRVVGSTETRKSEAGYSYRVGKVKYIPGTSTNGTADISATICGMAIKLEVKFRKDRQSPAQKEYEKSIKTAGGVYYIAKDFQSTYEWLNRVIEHLSVKTQGLFNDLSV